jgi:hypothetical protein
MPDTKEYNEFVKREFVSEKARMKWAYIFLIFGLGFLFTLTINPMTIWDKDFFWNRWLFLFLSALMVCLSRAFFKLGKKEIEKIEMKVTFIVIAVAVIVWAYSIMTSGLSIIWPKLIVDVLAILGVGFMFSRKNLMIIGLIMFMVSFIISSVYLIN